MDTRPTLRTVANESGFAVTTVSRALAGDPKIAEATRLRISGIAARLGYVPDRAAQRLRTGKTNVIALVLSPHEEIIGFRGSMIAGLQRVLQGTHFHIFMAPYGPDMDPMDPIRHIIRNGLADGLVFSGTAPDDPRVEYLAEAGFPFVSHGRTDSLRPHAWCDYDNTAFAAMAVDRLAGRGRRNLLLIPPNSDRTYARHMREGFLAATQRHRVGAVLRDDLTLSSSPQHLLHEIAPLCARQGIDGIIAPGEVAAMAAMAALSDSSDGLAGQVEVIAKQTSDTFGLYRPRIDAIFEDIRAAGETLGQLLLRRIAGEDPAALQVLHGPVANFRL